MSFSSKFIRSFFYRASDLIPSGILNVFPAKIILPTYHLVTDNVPLHIKYLYKPRTKKEFIKDLDFILKYYKPIDLNTLVSLTRSKEKLKENYFHLTFDDGLKECADVIAPILKEKGIPATFFVNPGFFDNGELMFRYKASLLINAVRHSNDKKYAQDIIPQILQASYPLRFQLDDLAESMGVDFKKYSLEQRPYMSVNEIKKLIADGFTVGAHSMDHPEYAQIPFEEQVRQTKESIDIIRRFFKPEHSVFAFPFTDHGVSKKFFDYALNSENRIADLTFGVAGMKRDYHPMHLQRIPMEKEISGDSIIKGEYLYYSTKILIKKNRIIRQ